MVKSEVMWLDKEDLENITAEYTSAEGAINEKVQRRGRAKKTGDGDGDDDKDDAALSPLHSLFEKNNGVCHVR